jgi:hypothetical protein
MILIAIMAPVIVMAVLLAGIATLAMIGVGVAALAALVGTSVERVSHLISSRRKGGRPTPDGKAQGWPQPTAESGIEYGYFRPAWDLIDEEAFQPVFFEGAVPVGVAAEASKSTDGGGVHSWEEVFPADEPDFEGPDAYTLIADSTEGR